MPGHRVAETDLDDENTSDTEFRYDEATQTIVAESACGRQAGGVMADSVERAAARSRALAAIMGAVESGRLAHLAGRIPRRESALASSPFEGLIET